MGMVEGKEVQYHINLSYGDAGEYCILPGDPGRCEKISKYFDNPVHIMSNREYTTYVGTLCGKKVSVVSTGIGGPSAAIAMEELCNIGVHTFIRVGTCGGINLDVKSGDIVVATGAIRCDGTSKEYSPIEYPAVSDFEVAKSLIEASKKLDKTYHYGVVQCKDSFYGQHSPDRMPVSEELLSKWEAWKRLGVLASEMESATLFVVADSRKVRCGTVLSVVWNQERKLKGFDDKENHDTECAIQIAVEAIKDMICNEKIY